MSDALWAELSAKFPKAVRAEGEAKVAPYETVRVERADFLPLASWLKDEKGFAYLDMATAIDWVGPVVKDGFVMDPNPNPFLPEGATPQVQAATKHPKVQYRDAIECVYLLSNLETDEKLFVRVEIPRAEPEIDSLVPLFKAADWQERETFDLMGVRYAGHPNLQKILTPDFLEGHPLRKDYVHKKDRYD